MRRVRECWIRCVVNGFALLLLGSYMQSTVILILLKYLLGKHEELLNCHKNCRNKIQHRGGDVDGQFHHLGYSG